MEKTEWEVEYQLTFRSAQIVDADSLEDAIEMVRKSPHSGDDLGDAHVEPISVKPYKPR